MALALKADHFRKGSFATKLTEPPCPLIFRFAPKAT